MTGTDKLQKTTNDAISQGKEKKDAAMEKNVDQVKAVGAGYVEQVQGLAQSSLDTAKSYLSESGIGEPTTTDKFQKKTSAATSQGKETTDAAISQGKKHVDTAVSQGEKGVDQAKAVGAGYVEQVLGLAQSALDTAKSYLPESGTGEPTATDKLQKKSSSAISQGKETKDAAISQGKETTNEAISKGQKEIDDAKAAGTGYVEQVKGLSQSAIDTAKTQLPESVSNQLPGGAKSSGRQR